MNTANITTDDETNRMRAAVTPREWADMWEMYRHVTSEGCDDTALARVVQGVFGNALTGDFEAAQKAVSYLDGTIVFNDDGSYDMVER